MGSNENARKSVTSAEGPSNEDSLRRTESFIYYLTNDNFAEGIAPVQPTLVLFHTTWCGACKLLLPVFREVARELGEKSTLRFALYECLDNDDKIEEYYIAYVPVVKLFKQGKFEYDYTGGRDRNSLMNFAEKLGTSSDNVTK